MELRLSGSASRAPRYGPAVAEDRPKDEPEPTASGDAEQAEPADEDLDPEQAHNALIGRLLGGPTDLAGPTKAGDE